MGLLQNSFLILFLCSISTSHLVHPKLKDGLTNIHQETGVCCTDNCCPEGLTCNSGVGQCLKIIPQKPIELPIHPQLGNVNCPDKKSVCPNEHTCCKLRGHEGYGCCSGVRAVCCEDELHCCPENTTCDTEAGNCKKNVKTAPLLKYYRNSSLHSSSKTILCPDGKTICPDKTTCCSLVTGTYGCCPTAEGICCPDKLHCCPQGYFCDPNSDKCKHGDTSLPKIKKSPAIFAKMCPDGTTVCGVNDTCCKHADETWSCCPEANGVCCADGYHCCPQNYTCNLKASTCRANVNPLDMETCGAKILPGLGVTSYNTSKTVACGGSHSRCQNHDTCCPFSSGDWGCCPGKDSVCCSDKQHCCPQGFKCESGGNCVQTVFWDLL